MYYFCWSQLNPIINIKQALKWQTKMYKYCKIAKIVYNLLATWWLGLTLKLVSFTRCLVEGSQTVEAFLALYEYMDPSSVRDVLSALLMLPKSSLLADGDKMSLYGQAVLTVLTKNISNARSGNATFCLSQVHLHSLAALHSTCYSVQLEDIFLQVCIAQLKLKRIKTKGCID